MAAAEKPVPLDPSLVQEFVAKAHGDLARVQKLLAQHPTLVNAAWAWGGGDWETGLGAAGRMGNRPIAHYLLEHGARLDLYAAAMLGRLEVVQAILTAFPEQRAVPGPHGIPLIAHVKAGGPEAAEVVECRVAAVRARECGAGDPQTRATRRLGSGSVGIKAAGAAG